MSEAGPARGPATSLPPAEGGLIGRRLGKYEIRRIAGEGRSPVYEGWDPDLKRQVAVKTVRIARPGEDDPDAEERLARFRNEAEVGGRLQHPAIVYVSFYGESDGLAYLVMEYMDGGSLAQKLEAGEGLPLPLVRRVMADVLSGLAHAHRAEVLHRDIKPSNVMLNAEGRAKLADFGIAQLPGRRLTATGIMVGTPEYMPPETFLGHPVTERSDIWSAAVMLHEMLTGRCPFEGTIPAIMHQVLHGAAEPPSRRRHGLPPALDAVLARAMARRPEDRFPSAQAFAEAFDAAWTPTRTGSPRVLAIVAATACVAAAVGFGGREVACRGGDGPGWLCPTPPIPEPTPEPRPDPPRPDGDRRTRDPVPPVDLPALRRAAAEALAPIGCAFLSGDVAEDGRGVQVEGVARGDAAPRIRAALAAAVPGATLDWRVAVFEGPYCPVLDLLRPHAPRFGAPSRGLSVSPAEGRDRLRDGERLVLRLGAPDFAAHLRLDYLQSDGRVLRMQPTADYPGGRLAPGATALWGEERPGAEPPTVQEPLGTDLVMALATAAPAATRDAAQEITMAAYLDQLRAAIEAAQRNGAGVAAAALVLTILPR